MHKPKSRIFYTLFVANMLLLVVVFSGVFLVNYLNFKWFQDRFLNQVHQDEYLLINDIAAQLETEFTDDKEWIRRYGDSRLWQGVLERLALAELVNYPQLQDFIGPRPPPEGELRWESSPGSRNMGRPGHSPGGPGIGFVTRRLLLLDPNGNLVLGEQYTEKQQYSVDVRLPHEQNYTLVLQPDELGPARDLKPLKDRFITISILIVIAASVSLCISFLVARHITKPIQQLLKGARKWSLRVFDYRLPENRKDEFGILNVQFNALARRLENHDTHQKQWLQDVAHELRTPVTIIQGQIEAMLDDVLPTNSENLALLHTDILRLASLVKDLNELESTESAHLRLHPESTDLSALVELCVNTCRLRLASRDIGLEMILYPVKATVDAQRIEQVILNLLENCFRYTETGGRVLVSLGRQLYGISLVVEDSGPGVPANSLPNLFDRLYSVEPSRNKQTNGLGIGLAICQNIVTAHNGTIKARASDLGGLAIDILLPVDE